MHAGGDPPCRIDYVWVSGIPDKARLAMQQAQNGCSYSDHLGLEAVCAFHEKDADRCLTRLTQHVYPHAYVKLMIVHVGLDTSNWLLQMLSVMLVYLPVWLVLMPCTTLNPHVQCTTCIVLCFTYCS